MLSFRRLAIFVSLACAGVAVGCGGASKAGSSRASAHPIVLHMSNQLDSAQPLDIYAREVARLTHGSVRIDVGSSDHRGEANAERKVVADVRTGRAAMGWVGARVLDALGDRRFQPLIAPLLVDSYGLEQKVLQSNLVGPMLGSLHSLGVVGLGVEPGVMRRVLGITRPIRRPADVRGLRFGISESAIEAQTVRALGGIPRLVGPMASDTGLDALESQLDAIYGNLYFKHAAAVSGDLVLWPRPMVFFMNTKAYARLSAGQQRALRTAAADVVPQFTQYARADDTAGLRSLCSAGVAFQQTDLAAFRAAVRPVYAGIDRAAVAQIEALKRGTTADAIPACAHRAAAPVAARTVLDGVYRKTLTPAQAHSHVPENYGTFIRVFDRGRFAMTQTSPRACEWSYGHFVLHGPALEFINTDGGGIAPTNAGAKPGETVDLHWRLFRGALQLTSPDNADPGCGTASARPRVRSTSSAAVRRHRTGIASRSSRSPL